METVRPLYSSHYFKSTRNGFVHLMIETLIAASSAVTTIVTVSCADINTLVDRAKVTVLNLSKKIGRKLLICIMILVTNMV